MTRRIPTVLLTLLLGVGLGCPPRVTAQATVCADTTVVAALDVLTGPVEIRNDTENDTDDWRNVNEATVLRRGQEVRATNEGFVRVTPCDDAPVVRLLGGEVYPPGSSAAPPPRGRITRLFATLYPRARRTKPSGDRSDDDRLRGPVLLRPRAGLVAPDYRAVSWLHATDGPRAYVAELRVAAPGRCAPAGEAVWASATADTVAVFPDALLLPETKYHLRVRSEQEGGPGTAGCFTVVSEESHAELQSEIEALGAQGNALYEAVALALDRHYAEALGLALGLEGTYADRTLLNFIYQSAGPPFMIETIE